MGMNETPKGERIHIGIFGKRNAGKSSIINAITNQELAIVSNVLGTTTDPVQKSMELLPIGPVVLIDTPGIDDEGELGEKRISKTYQVLAKTDLALLVMDAAAGKTAEDAMMEEKIKERNIPYLCVYNKCDLITESVESVTSVIPVDNPTVSSGTDLYVSSTSRAGIQKLKACLGSLYLSMSQKEIPIVSDLVSSGDFVILVVPIDKAAPKGRLILPQQQTIRELLETGAISIVVRESELAETLKKLGQKPKLVITDSQAFELVSQIVTDDILLTSFSILMARHKGNFKQALSGVYALDQISDDSVILISEGCSHHRQCGDIGTEKLPRWIENFTGKKPTYEWTSGTAFPTDLSKYDLIIHCGSCMLNNREMDYRYSSAALAGVPMTNYGLAIAYMNHILARSIEILQ